MAYVAWHDRRAKARLEKTLNDHHTLEICIVLCVILLVMGLVDHMDTSFPRSVCELAGIVVFVKLVQLMMIAVRRTGRSDE